MPAAARAIEIEDFDDPRVAGYRDLKDRALRQRQGLFVVEGRVNLRWMLEASPHRPLSILVSAAALEALGALLAEVDEDVPIYVGQNEVLAKLVGYRFHRGCLALAERPAERNIEDLLGAVPSAQGPSRVLVLEGLSNHDNVGGIFRNAMAFGADAVVLCPRCCDPLYRKAIRTSMGGALSIPFARAQGWPDAPLAALRAAGYALLALHPAGDPIESVLVPGNAGPARGRAALILGTEGVGLSDAVLGQVDHRLRIGMAPGVDSLNVSTATGIALHHLFLGSGADGAAP